MFYETREKSYKNLSCLSESSVKKLELDQTQVEIFGRTPGS